MNRVPGLLGTRALFRGLPVPGLMGSDVVCAGLDDASIVGRSVAGWRTRCDCGGGASPMDGTPGRMEFRAPGLAWCWVKRSNSLPGVEWYWSRQRRVGDAHTGRPDVPPVHFRWQDGKALRHYHLLVLVTFPWNYRILGPLV
uniref:Uncharacterized protein n=1 Tax=Anopheles melas TaxID=34690 RepID=A0A182TLC2_9DIPT